MSGSTDLLDLIAGQVTDAETAWSIGTFGAIAEFTRDAEETAAFDRGAGAISVVTARGGMRIDAHDALRPCLRVAHRGKLESACGAVPTRGSLRHE